MFLINRLVLDEGSFKDLGRRELLASLYLSGEGIEIGAAQNPLSLPKGAKAKYVDHLTREQLREACPDLAMDTRTDIVDDGSKLATIPDASQDFVIANHVIEHIQDPIGAIGNFLRVLKPRGYLFMAMPDKRWSFDFERPVTTFEHLVRDYREGPEWSIRGHFEEDARFLRGLTDQDEVEKYVERAVASGDDTHFHVWRQEDMLAFVSGLKTVVGFDVEIEAYLSHQPMMEGIIVLRKGESGKDRSHARASLALLRESSPGF
jgi:SAM-dependent methyltransferase